MPERLARGVIEMAFYFTNPTYDRHKAREIQLKIEAETGLELVNPFYNKAGVPTKEIKALDKGDRPEVSEGEIIHNDLKLVRDHEGVIAYITKKTSWGSISETFYSAYVLGKPTHLIFDPDSRGGCEHCGITNDNNPDHPWPKGNSTRIFGSVEAFIAYAKEKLKK